MKRFRSLLALLAIASIAACGDLPFEPQSSDSDTEQTQRGAQGSGY
jgi:predicted small lipoprotein YifL